MTNTQPSFDSLPEIVEELRDCEDAAERMMVLMEFGDESDPLGEEYRIPEFQVQGCTSKVWLVPKFDTDAIGNLCFLSDSDSSLVRGLAALLVEMTSQLDRGEVPKFDYVAALEYAGVSGQLSQSRSSGLKHMIARIRALAALSQPDA
ncbi:MAG: SufE family protein [Planctomycetota bacterium]